LILVDTNVVLDVATKDRRWSEWSSEQLEIAFGRDDVAINDVIYAELAAGYGRADELDVTLRSLGLERSVIPKFALFLAGHAYRQYRRQQGTKTNVLSDFFIGAHAAVEDAQLLTRGPKRIRAYFPSVTLISP
jgi:predicted nucleic acid-binding protein